MNILLGPLTALPSTWFRLKFIGDAPSSTEYDTETLIVWGVVLACVCFRANTSDYEVFSLHLWQQFDHRNEEKRVLSRAAG